MAQGQGKKRIGAAGRGKHDGAHSGPRPKPEELPIKAKPASDRGQNLDQNTRNPGYQQDR